MRFPLRGRTFVVISSIDWDFLWQGHQEISLRLAREGNRILFLDNTGVRSIRPSDAGRILQRVARAMRPHDVGSSPGGGVTVVPPLLLPFPRSRIARAVNDRILLPRLARRLRALGASDPIVLTFLPTPNALRLASLLRTPRSTLVYYCIADFQELSDLGADLLRSEVDLARAADAVLVQGAVFASRFAGLSANIHEFQFGVDLASFDPAAVRAPHPDVARLPRPIIGYTGGLHRHVDIGLLARVADTYASGSVVLVGPLQTDTAGLRAMRNVHLLGMRPFGELPALIAGFDVALIPYARTVYTDTVFPTKLFEYLAMGRPVVSTDLPEVRKLVLPTDAVRIGSNVDAFIDAIRAALAEPAAARAAERRDLARPRDWSVVVRRMAEVIAAAGPA